MTAQDQEIAPLLVDARGHRWPVPTLRLRRALEQVPPGRVVRLLADDPMARIDVPHFCRTEGFSLIAVDHNDASLCFDVARP